MTPYGTDIRLRRGDYWLSLLTPGNTGEANSVSFKTENGLWITHVPEETYAKLRPYKNATWFNNATTFFIHKNESWNGFLTIESCSNRSYFMMNSGYYGRYRVKFDQLERHSSMDYFAWAIDEKGKYS